MTAMSSPGPEPSANELLGELIDLVRATDDEARAARRTARRAERNRIGMLYIHSLAALAIAPLFAVAAIDSPAFAAMRQIPGAPYSVAVVLGIGGILLSVSAAGGHRMVAFAGLGLLAAWYATMAVTFALSAAVWSAGHHPDSLTEAVELLIADTRGKPSVYAVPLYAHFCAVMVRHMMTLRGKVLDDRALES